VSTNPLYPLDLLERAEEFLEAFHQLPPEQEVRRWISWPRYFLLCHAVELALKAFLSRQGIAEETLRKCFGHKIDKLVAEAMSRSLGIQQLHADKLKRLSEAHAGPDYRSRYPLNVGSVVFATDNVDQGAVPELFRAVAISIRGRST
jgi:hypothetical protein